MSAESDIEKLKKRFDMELHPTGRGLFKEIWRSTRQVTVTTPKDTPAKSLASSIYFILTRPNIITWHTLLVGDEMFLWHAGGRMKIHGIDSAGNHTVQLLGDALKNPDCVYQALVPNNTEYAVELEEGAEYCLFSAVVMPGWELQDWHEWKRSELLEKFPQHEDIVKKFTTS